MNADNLWSVDFILIIFFTSDAEKTFWNLNQYES